MKSYDERIESIFRKYDERLAEKKRRRTLLLRSCAIGAGAAAVIGIGLTTYALRPPKKPAPSQSGIVAETETTSAEMTFAPTSPSTSAQPTSTAAQTTAATTTTTTSSARSTTATVRTTVTAARTTWTAVTTTSIRTSVTTVATSVITTTLTQEQEVPEIILETTAATDILEMPEIGTTANIENKSYDEMLALNFMVIRLSEDEVLVSGVVEADSDLLTEQVGELTLRPTCYTDFLPEELTAQIYSIKSNSLKKQVAVRFTGSEKYIIYNVVKP